MSKNNTKNRNIRRKRKQENSLTKWIELLSKILDIILKAISIYSGTIGF